MCQNVNLWSQKPTVNGIEPSEKRYLCETNISITKKEKKKKMKSNAHFRDANDEALL